MAVDSVGSSYAAQQAADASATYKRKNVAPDSKALTMTDFYTLMAAQLRYQDSDNPMDTSEMMAQMVQEQMMMCIDNMTDVISNLSIVNTTSYAASMTGKEVTVAELDEDGKYTGESTKGTVTGVMLGDEPKVYINGKEYGLTQIMAIGDTPENTKPSESEETEPSGGEQSGSEKAEA